MAANPNDARPVQNYVDDGAPRDVRQYIQGLDQWVGGMGRE